MSKQRNRYALVALAAAGLFLAGLSEASLSLAQSQEGSAPSVAEAARRAREQKKNSTKPVRTVTNEDLPAAPVGSANSGNAQVNPAKADEGAAAATDDAKGTATVPVNEEQSKRKKAESAAALERAKKNLAQAEGELDVMQRKLVLDNDSYYSKADFDSDKEGKANLDAEAQQINDKKHAVDALRARVAELQALVGEQPAAEPDKNSPPQ